MKEHKQKKPCTIIDFKPYLEKAKIKDQSEEGEIDNSSLLDEMATVMSMSTDELFLELNLCLANSGSVREMSKEAILYELTGRLALMEHICLLASQEKI